jgi:AcrR family transcriptional regulator
VAKASAQRRQELHALKRSRIVAAAEKIFLSEGIEGASLRAIAREAGYTPGALYAYYASKEELYADILRASLERLLAAVRAGAKGPPAQALRGALRAFWRFYRDHPEDLSLSMYVQHGLAPKGLTPKLDRELNDRLGATLDVIRSNLAGLRRDMPAAEREHHTRTLLSAIMGVLLLVHTGRLKKLGGDPDRLVDHHIALTLAAARR